MKTRQWLMITVHSLTENHHLCGENVHNRACGVCVCVCVFVFVCVCTLNGRFSSKQCTHWTPCMLRWTYTTLSELLHSGAYTFVAEKNSLVFRSGFFKFADAFLLPPSDNMLQKPWFNDRIIENPCQKQKLIVR